MPNQINPKTKLHSHVNACLCTEKIKNKGEVQLSVYKLNLS